MHGVALRRAQDGFIFHQQHIDSRLCFNCRTIALFLWEVRIFRRINVAAHLSGADPSLSCRRLKCGGVITRDALVQMRHPLFAVDWCGERIRVLEAPRAGCAFGDFSPNAGRTVSFRRTAHCFGRGQVAETSGAVNVARPAACAGAVSSYPASRTATEAETAKVRVFRVAQSFASR